MTDSNQSEAIEFGKIPSSDELKAMREAAQNPAQDAENEGPKSAPAAEDTRPAWLPEKFRTEEDFARSYSELESTLGRQAQEMGTLRALNDQLLELKGTASVQDPQPQLPEITADEVLNNPGIIQETAETVATQATGQVASRVDELEAQLALNAFEGRHPSFREDQSDPKFQAFVQGSGYRANLAAKAASGNLQAAEELWSAWDEVRPSGEDETEIASEVEADAADAAEAMATSGGQGAGDQGPKPISRQELARIRIEEEDRYYSADFQEYINYMYRNKLVK